MDRDRFAAGLVAWLNRKYGREGIVFDADTPLFEGGLIDSLRILELIAWTERELGCTIPDAQILTEHFRSPARIAEVFVEAGRA